MKTYHNFDLTNYNSFRLKSIGKIVYFPESLCKLRFLLSTHPKCPVLANGTNVLLRPQIDELICLSLLPTVFNKQLNRISVTANVKLQSLVSYTVSKNLGGFENLWGIPGSIGGAISGNAGSGNTTISDNLSCIKTVNHYGEINSHFKHNLLFERRYCSLSDLHEVIVQAWFDIPDKETDKNKLNKAKEWRKTFLPYHSAGGLFKNWYELKPYETELRALKINNLQFANHINILYSKGNTTYNDIMDAINKIQKIVKNPLKLEVKII